MWKILVAVCAAFCQLALGAVEIDWSAAEEVQPGVALLRLETEQPRLMKIYLMRIDLEQEGLQFTGTGRDSDWGKPMPDYEGEVICTKRIRTRDFMRNARENGENMIVAANSAPWSPWEEPFDHQYAHPHGLAILDGEVICDSRPQYAVLVVYRNGEAEIVSEVPESDYGDIRVAVSGFAVTMSEGRIDEGLQGDASRHPRTAYGLSEDRRYFYILVVDGRQEGWSLGATVYETAEWLKAAGAFNAMNMDGGGSSTLCYWDEAEGRVVTVNRHTADGYTRPVGANLGIILNPSR